MLLTPPEPLQPLPDSDKLTQAKALELWLDDVEAFHRLRARYEALQTWGGKCWGKAPIRSARVTVKTWVTAHVNAPTVERLV